MGYRRTSQFPFTFDSVTQYADICQNTENTCEGDQNVDQVGIRLRKIDYSSR